MQSMNKYMTPEDLMMAEELAGIDDPEARMLALNPMAQTAKGLQGIRPQTHSNGRVVAATSPLEAIGAAGANITGAYMNKQLMDKYSGILDQNNADRKGAARKLAGRYYPGALRGAGQDPMGATAYPVDPQNPAEMYSLDPY